MDVRIGLSFKTIWRKNSTVFHEVELEVDFYGFFGIQKLDILLLSFLYSLEGQGQPLRKIHNVQCHVCSSEKYT